MLRISRGQRGATIAELLTVIVVLGLLMTMIVVVIAPMMRSQNRSQAKLDTVQSAAAALYRIQRDLRQTYYLGTYACTTGAAASCTQPTAFAATWNAIAFPTAYSQGNGAYKLQAAPSTPAPGWQGIMVYWIDSAGDLNWAFDVPTGYTPKLNPSASDAAKAVADATTGVAPVTKIAANIQQLAIVVLPSQTNIIELQMIAQSTQNGSVNETTYRSDVLARQ